MFYLETGLSTMSRAGDSLVVYFCSELGVTALRPAWKALAVLTKHYFEKDPVSTASYLSVKLLWKPWRCSQRHNWSWVDGGGVRLTEVSIPAQQMAITHVSSPPPQGEKTMEEGWQYFPFGSSREFVSNSFASFCTFTWLWYPMSAGREMKILWFRRHFTPKSLL